jgi:hypothetical protein
VNLPRLMLGLAACLWSALVGLGAEAPLYRPVSVDYRGLPLPDVLRDLGERAGVRITADANLLEGKDNVIYAAKDQEAGRVLTRILFPRGLRLEATDGASVTLVKRPAVEELAVRREPIFEFAAKPTVTRAGDRTTIRFETRSFSDVTVAIEDAEGRIVRHLASGVLGDNAPEPFQWNSKKQVIVWDGKNDRDEYIDDQDRLVVRVSLGLTPRFERTLYWSPHKRIAEMAPVMAATEEGVVVAEGYGVDSVRLYDHDGAYVRTIYPFPAAAYSTIQGLEWVDLPHGRRIPMKNRWYGQTLLTSGDSALTKGPAGGMGRGVSGIAAQGKHLALVDYRLNRVTTAGTTWGDGLEGGACGIAPGFLKVQISDYQAAEGFQIGPTSAAFSPDGKWLYLAGFSYRCAWYNYSVQGNLGYDTLHGVGRMPADGRGPMETFLGSLKLREGYGSEPGTFINAASVDCDSRGRVYVADFMNDRVQVFSPEGRFLKAIPITRPAVVRLHRRTDELYVFSWLVPSRLLWDREPTRDGTVEPTLTHFGTFDDPRVIRTYNLSAFVSRWRNTRGVPHGLWSTGEIDSWADPPTIWLGRECRNDAELANVHPGDGGQRTPWETAGTKLLREQDGHLQVLRDFGQDTLREAVRAKPPVNAIQRLAVNPATGRLYVGEPDSGPTGKAFCNLLEIDPETGAIKTVELPFNPMEYAFDLEGNIYLRNTDMIARYAFPSFREIPWDYGEERERLGADGGIGGRVTAVAAGLRIPATWPVCYHQGGIGVSPKGYVVASCGYRFQGIGTTGRAWALRGLQNDPAVKAQKPYQARLYPGRASNSLTPCLHIWDPHGRIVHEDAVPGVAQVDGVEIDRDLNLYFMHTPRRVLDGEPYFNVTSSTMMKARPGVARVLSTASADVPLPDDERPRRPHDLNRVPEGNLWVSNADWFFGGVGFAAFNAHNYCGCWFSRFSLDYFARTIAPEPYQYSVAVLDSSGNLVLRMGRCGNVDDDGIALFHACYVATHTDRRIFISDVGNGRILSVKLGYQTEERVPLARTLEQGKG